MNVKALAEKWVEEHINVDGLVEDVKSRFESGSYGYNEDKTEWGMFLFEVVTDSYTRFTNLYLANHYGIISKEELKQLEAEDKWNIDYEAQFKEIEKEIVAIIKEKVNSRLKGEFEFAWTEHYENLPIYYGLCYKQAV